MDGNSEEINPYENQIDILQETIAKLIVENEDLEVKYTNLTFETNEVIGYLKNLVEEKDDDIARLEDMLENQNKNHEIKTRQQYDKYEEEKDKLLNEIEKLKSSMSIMDTQLGNQHRIGLEIVEMSTKFNEMKKTLEEKEETIRRMEADERSVKIAATEKVRKDLQMEYENAVHQVRLEANLENKAHTLMKNEVIEHLEVEIKKKTMEAKRLEDTIKDKEEIINKERVKFEEKSEENKKLRQLLEKSNITTEKSMKDGRRRIEELENKNKTILNKYMEIESDLKLKIDELTETLAKYKNDAKVLENRLLQEQELRIATVEAQKAQNKKITELKSFFTDVLTSDNQIIESVVTENRNSVFAHLALIVSRIPIVR